MLLFVFFLSLFTLSLHASTAVQKNILNSNDETQEMISNFVNFLEKSQQPVNMGRDATAPRGILQWLKKVTIGGVHYHFGSVPAISSRNKKNIEWIMIGARDIQVAEDSITINGNALSITNQSITAHVNTNASGADKPASISLASGGISARSTQGAVIVRLSQVESINGTAPSYSGGPRPVCMIGGPSEGDGMPTARAIGSRYIINNDLIQAVVPVLAKNPDQWIVCTTI